MQEKEKNNYLGQRDTTRFVYSSMNLLSKRIGQTYKINHA